ncbi:hypothetical protein DAI22_05g282200 [Oryza sativa Japonica Group]|nr:hypothetical protein DAI22_05g282200 [Oryza sativa Japonica Group]
MAVAYTSDHRHHHHHHDVVGRLSSLVALCGRGLSRASRRLLLLDRRCYGGGRSAPAKQDGGGGEAIWQRTILMGERCQPLDFDGAVHYDSFGRRMAAPRSASSLSSCCSSDSLGAATSELDMYTHKEAACMHGRIQWVQTEEQLHCLHP